MRTSRRSVTAALALVAGLSLCSSGCVTTATDVLQPAPTVRAQMPSSPSLPPLPPSPLPVSYKTTYTYLPETVSSGSSSVTRMPQSPMPQSLMPQSLMPQGLAQGLAQGPSPAPAKQPLPATLSGPKLTPGGPHHEPRGHDGPLDDLHPGPGPIPTELNKYSHPPYTIAPPDILVIDALRLIPKPPYRIEAMELLMINATVDKAPPLPNQPISGQFLVSPEGTVNLGFNYGAVRVAGMTLDQARAAIAAHLGKIVANPEVTIALVQFRGLQQIRGEHLVRPDGSISLGTYGSVWVAGMTLGQAKTHIEQYLSQYLLNPQISIDVFAYNSKKYYVILDGGGFGQQIIALPSTGNETVLDAISNVYGLAPVSSKRRIWVARPAPCGYGCAQILPVDWRAITEGALTCTNYQLFPGDRVFVSANKLIAFDNYLSMVLAPVERLLGITLLGSSTVNSIRSNGNGTTGFIIP